jgi:hypothetical protein
LNTNVHGDVIGTMIIGMLSWEVTPVFVQVGGVTTTWAGPLARALEEDWTPPLTDMQIYLFPWDQKYSFAPN